MKFGYTSRVGSAFVLASGFASSAACADTPVGAASGSGQTPSLVVDATGMFFIILILAISFAWIRTLPLIDKLEAWLTRE